MDSAGPALEQATHRSKEGKLRQKPQKEQLLIGLQPIPGLWVPENLEEPKESKILWEYPFPSTPHSESHAVPQFRRLAMGCAYSHQGTAGC